MSGNMHNQQLTDKDILFSISNPRQTLCYATNELEDLVKSTPTDNKVKALGLLKKALSLL